MSASNALAQTTNIELNRAVNELQNGRYESGLAALRRLSKTSNDARIDFYKGYAFEKLGKCVAAKVHYNSALKSDNKKLKKLSKETLAGFTKRCTIINEPKSKAEVASSNTGWKIFAWTALVVGTATLVATPIKEGFDRDLAAEAEPYFFYKHGCKIDFGEINPEGCDVAALDTDERYPLYEETVSKTKLINTIGYVAGATLVATGAITLITITISEHSVAISPTQNGAQFSVSF